jgi:hypothetical protein
MRAVEIRPMEEEDLPSAERASAATFLEADRRNLRGRVLGCHVRPSGGRVRISQNRERLWYPAA